MVKGGWRVMRVIGSNGNGGCSPRLQTVGQIFAALQKKSQKDVGGKAGCREQEKYVPITDPNP